MKLSRIVLALAVIIIAFSACSKDKKGIDDGMRLTVDGKEIEFSAFTKAEYDSTSGIHNLHIRGTDTDMQPNLVALGLTQEQPIVTGTYIHSTTNPDFYVTLDWSPAGEDYTDPYYAGLDGSDPMSITITSITTTRVQGTFQGTVRRGAGATKVITNGSFNLELE